MKQGDFYRHFRKNTEYCFCGIALPITEFAGKESQLEKINPAQDADTPKGEPIREIQLYNFFGLMVIDSDVPHVIYQSEHDYNTDLVWGRKVDDFFGYKKVEDDSLVKRFVLQK